MCLDLLLLLLLHLLPLLSKACSPCSSSIHLSSDLASMYGFEGGRLTQTLWLLDRSKPRSSGTNGSIR
uniref:Secreted protein n=1 Tax=Phakopsora pachyrhizi TaxID=170000 RepID=A0A0S1MJ43_PHAPC